MFSKAAIPLYIETSNAQGFQFLYNIANICYFLFLFFLICDFVKVCQVAVKWYFIVVWFAFP